MALEDGKPESTIVQDNTNLAIQGLFRYIDPESDEAKALEDRGYVKTNWGYDTYNKLDPKTKLYGYDAGKEAAWSSEFMCGYSDADYQAKKAPIYLSPMNETTCTTTGLSNGYGFRSTMK